MAADNRTISGTDEVAQAAVDAFNETLPVLWETMHPLWKRWSLDPNVMGEPNGSLLKQGVRTKVHEEVDGGDDYRWVTDFSINNAVGLAAQTANFLSAGNAVTQTLMHAHWAPALFQGWKGVGFTDMLQIRGDATLKFNYVTQRAESNTRALSRILAQAIYGIGYLTSPVAATAAASLQGLAAACYFSNSILDASTSVSDGHYGGIDRIAAANADWRGNTATMTTPLQPSHILTQLMAAQDGEDSPTLLVCGSGPYGIMWNWYEAKQRVLNNNDPTLGKAAPLSFDNISILRDKTLDLTAFNTNASGIFMTSATGSTLTEIPSFFGQALYGLNENYFRLVTWKGGASKGGAPKVLPELKSTTNLNVVFPAVWYGTLACGHPKRQFMIISITT